MAKKPTRKNPKLQLNKDSLKPVSEASLQAIAGGACTVPTNVPCPWPSTTNPGCVPCGTGY
jgi:hypothetical protein